MEGAGSPFCFSSLACCECQANGQASCACMQCVPSSGSGSGQLLDSSAGKALQTSMVPASVSSVSTCGLLQPWGSCVRVGRRAAHNDERIAPSLALGYVSVPIDLHDSMVGNPFKGEPPERLNSAFDELLGCVLIGYDEFDKILSEYYRRLDDHRGGICQSEPVTRTFT